MTAGHNGREQVILSWSGGKDSSLALAALSVDARYEVVSLITTFTRGYERVSIHGVRRTLLESQAASLGLPLFPLWGRNTRALSDEFIASGFQARLVCVDTQQISGSFAGNVFDKGFLEAPAKR